MNKKKCKRRIMVLLLIMLLVFTGIKNAAYAEDSSPTIYSVTDYHSFKNAVEKAKDGDMIRIMGVITVDTDMTIGSENKHLTIQRRTADSYINFISGNMTFVNVTFDGAWEKSPNSMIMLKTDTSFVDCAFQNCGDKSDYGSSGSVGGAVRVDSGTSKYTNCIFTDNRALVGGHIAVYNAVVELWGCTLNNGMGLNNGGAISIMSNTGKCNIVKSLISDNQAYDYGGGISNSGTVTIEGTKIYNNSAVSGGADIANRVNASIELKDSLEQLVELFEQDGILPLGWICDYDFEEGIYISDVDPYQVNALLKLQYDIIPEQNTDDPSDQENTEDDTEEPGDPVPEPSEPSTEEPSEPSTEETEKPTIPPDTENPTEEPTETPTEDNTEGSDTDEGKEEIETAAPSGTNENTDIDVSISDSSTNTNVTDNSSTSTNSNSSVDSSTHNNTTNTDNHVVSADNSDHSYITENNDSSDNSTVNNYYTTQIPADNQKRQSGNDTVIVVPNSATTSNNTSVSNSKVAADISEQVDQGQRQEIQYQTNSNNANPNIKIDAKGVDVSFTYNETDGYDISINSDETATNSSDETATNSSDEKDEFLSLIDIVQFALMIAIFICFIWKPGKIRE